MMMMITISSCTAILASL